MSSASTERNRPRLSVVLSTLGNYDVLRRVLDGYERQDAPPGSFEVVVVVDQADPDPAAADAAIGTRSYPVRRLTGRRPGLSANRNTGWEAAQAPIILFTDNDTIPVRGLVSEHLKSHARNPEREAAVAGHIRWAKGIKVTPFMKWLDYGIQFDFKSLRGKPRSWAQLYGANSSIKRAMLELVGGYDEVRLPYLYEDLDWGYRAREHGLRVIYNRRAIVDHWRPMTVEVWRARAPMLAATEWQFCQLHPDVPPWFHRMFTDAMLYPPARRWPQVAAGFVPKWVPWLGPRIWGGASLGWRQQIAPPFLEAWERALSGEEVSAAPDVDALLSERGQHS